MLYEEEDLKNVKISGNINLDDFEEEESFVRIKKKKNPIEEARKIDFKRHKPKKRIIKEDFPEEL